MLVLTGLDYLYAYYYEFYALFLVYYYFYYAFHSASVYNDNVKKQF